MSLFRGMLRQDRLVDARTFVRQHHEKRSQCKPLPLPRHVWCLTHGFFDESFRLYHLDRNDHHQYVSDLLRYRTRRLNGKRALILDDKIMFESMFHRFVPVPTNVAIIHGRRVVALQPSAECDLSAALVDWFKHFGSLAIKPLGGGGGNNVVIVHPRGNEAFCNGREMTLAQVVECLDLHKAKMLVTQFVHQHDYAAAIFCHASNTLRVVTMIDPLTQEPFIPIAVHRFGCSQSAPVDNWAQGGMSAPIDLDSGTMGTAACFWRSQKLEHYDVHPETQAPIAGVTIPRWTHVRDTLLQLARRFCSHLKQVGWDIIVTEDGFSVIEGNNYTGVNMLQVHQPLLCDPRVRRFYQHHGFIG